MRSWLPRTGRLTLDAWSHGLPRWLGYALDHIPGDPEEASLVRGAQVHAIVRLTPFVMAASCLNGAIMLATFAEMGALRLRHWIWALLLLAMAVKFLLAWRRRGDHAKRSASRRTIRRLVLNGAAFGALWGVVPATTFAGAPLDVQLFVACLTAGMMSAGGFVLATVPLAGLSYVVLMATGALCALLQDISLINLAIIALLVSYTAVLIVNINWSAALFVDSRLAQAQLLKEVAAREQAQARMMHADRMTALGELASGVAHDFNNLLQIIIGGASRIERRPENRDEVICQAQRIQEAVEVGSTISRRLLAFARREPLSIEAIDTSALVADVGEMLTHTIGPPIEIHLDVSATPGHFLADRGQLETVLLNLATNARDAMPNGGDLTVSAASVAFEHDSEAPRLNAGRYVRIAVSDTGTGMDRAILARVAEPFFTTKPKGMGTGLGLPMAKDFAEQSGGAFSIESQPGCGTTVTLWLPQADLSRAPQSEDSAYEAARSEGGNRRVLVVEDDEMVREILMTSLEDAGFRTLGAENAQSAIEHLDHGAKVDALVADFAMPGMNGIDLIREVRARKPRLPAILLTGQISDVATQAVRYEHITLLQKPVRPTRVAKGLVALMAKL